MNFYNEHDAGAAAWLRELIAEGHLPAGVVEQRDIQDLTEADLAGFTQVHLFAGIGGWPHALRLAGWPDDRPCWTGSCPCQPFSDAGGRRGEADERHLWPDMRRLAEIGRPPVVFGEQVASRLGRDWLAGVRADLEELGYAVGAADLCSAGVAAPHIRQRLFWVADAGYDVLAGAGQGRAGELEAAERAQSGIDAEPDGVAVRLADAVGERRGREHALLQRAGEGGRYAADRAETPGGGEAGGVGDAAHTEGARLGQLEHELHAPPASFWSAFDLIPCRDGKARRIEPGTFPLAHGVPGRVGLLRGYGNAINPHLAAAFVRAYLAAAEGVPTC